MSEETPPTSRKEKTPMNVIHPKSDGLESRPDLESKLSEQEILKQSLDEARARDRENFDKYLRASAELENFRKRSEKRIQDARQWAKEEILLPIVSLCDGLDQAYLSTQNASDIESVKKGLELVALQFKKYLSDVGVAPIKTEGQKLNPDFHEVIAQEKNADLEDGTIIAEIQKGYTLNDRVLRPSRVKVSVKP